MDNSSKSYRINAKVDTNRDYELINVNLNQDYETFDILSLTINSSDTYKLHNSDYGVIVGRVVANGNFGVPNAKISIFIKSDNLSERDRQAFDALYPYTSPTSKNEEGIRYNLLPDNVVSDCHEVVGTFPNKSYLLENDVLLEVFDKYYKYTVRSNNSGDYIICGIPTGQQSIHMDLDISDCGILSQKPRDFVYKGYNIELFENPNKFKSGTDYSQLTQVYTTDKVINVYPFWGNSDQGETIGITKCDFEIPFKFEPTCVFLGSVVSDNASNGVSHKCVPTNQMGAMDELVTGEGTIEMIRKTPGGNVEEFQIKGTQLINTDGIWCYQIPMNLDYMMTDEYGNMVPTDDPEKGIPTRTRVRFRVSLFDNEENNDNYFRCKLLVPNNPDFNEDIDYNFGTDTKDSSYRDLLWNCVYSVKSYIPRFQQSQKWKNERFSGIKHCNIHGQNNPIPYNNIRIKLPLMFTILCALIKAYIFILKCVNHFISLYVTAMKNLFSGGNFAGIFINGRRKIFNSLQTTSYSIVRGDLCPDMEGWYFAPSLSENKPDIAWIAEEKFPYNILEQTLTSVTKYGDDIDDTSIDEINMVKNDNGTCITMNTDYLISCLEMNLAQEYRVINFDFYNDWINGLLYIPRWSKKIRPKMSFLFGLIKIKEKVKGCMSDTSIFANTRYYVQQCSLYYRINTANQTYTSVASSTGCRGKNGVDTDALNCHKGEGFGKFAIFGKTGGLINEIETSKKQKVYYPKPYDKQDKKVLLFANDLILLGSLNDCDENGLPKLFNYITSSSYKMPTNLALTTLDGESYIFGKSDGTICSGKKDSTTGETINRLPNTYSGTRKAYEGTKEEVEYSGYADAIAVTEAAGISWDYTGPEQYIGEYSSNETSSETRDRLKKDKKYMYNPGGHFLGISCTNSETNIKSCINLKRICEAGTSISQRREILRGFDGDNSEGLYSYYVPTGLISTEEITSKDLRNMFATMNMKKLIADNNIGSTYNWYNMSYAYADGFDGGLYNYTNVSNSPYKRKINNIVDETIDLGIEKSLSYDVNESGYTYMKTSESSSVDYYNFRFGFKGNEKPNEQKEHFLLKDGSGNVAFPQYENSFYFYFGLHDGSTALDEFNKQFNANCENNKIKRETTIRVTSSYDYKTEKKGTIIITAMNIQLPYKYECYFVDSDNKTIFASGTCNNESGIVIITGTTTGKHEIIVKDYDDIIYTKEVYVGEGLVKCGISTVDFRTSSYLGKYSFSPLLYSGRTGGYFEIDDSFSLKNEEGEYETYSISGNSVNINVTDNSGVKVTTKCYTFKDVIDDTFKHYIYVFNEGDYIINFVKENEFEISVFRGKIKSNKKYNIYLNNKYVKYRKIDDENCYVISGLTDSEKWADALSVKPSKEDISKWALKYSVMNRESFGTPFSSGFIAVSDDGKYLDNTLFGQPENIEGLFDDGGLYNNILYYSDYELYDGYNLDDNASIYCTDKETYIDEKRKMFSNNGISNDGIVVTNVIYKAYPTELSDDIVKSSQATYRLKIAEGNELVENSAYLIEYPDSFNEYGVCHIDNGNKYLYVYGEKPSYDDASLGEVLKRCRIYPTVTYPVVRKEFKVNVKLFQTTDNQFLTYMVDDEKWDECLSPMVSRGIFEGYIYGGITYQGYFGNVNMIRNFNEYDLTQQIRSEKSDYERESVEFKWLPIVTPRDGNIIYDEDNLSLTITEGAPSDYEKNKDLNTPNKIELNTITNYENANFHKRLYYKNVVVSGEGITTYTLSNIYPMKTEKINNEVSYYYVKGCNLNDIFDYSKRNIDYYDILNSDTRDKYLDILYSTGATIGAFIPYMDKYGKVNLSYVTCERFLGVLPITAAKKINGTLESIALTPNSGWTFLNTTVSSITSNQDVIDITSCSAFTENFGIPNFYYTENEMKNRYNTLYDNIFKNNEIEEINLGTYTIIDENSGVTSATTIVGVYKCDNGLTVYTLYPNMTQVTVNNENPNYIIIIGNEKEITSDGGVLNFTIKPDNIKWHYIIDTSKTDGINWYEIISSNSGLTVNFVKNNTGINRKLTFYCETDDKLSTTQKISVIQYHDKYIKFDINDYIFASGGGSTVINVNCASGVPWTLNNEGNIKVKFGENESVSYSGEGSKTVNIKVLENIIKKSITSQICLSADTAYTINGSPVTLAQDKSDKDVFTCEVTGDTMEEWSTTEAPRFSVVKNFVTSENHKWRLECDDECYKYFYFKDSEDEKYYEGNNKETDIILWPKIYEEEKPKIKKRYNIKFYIDDEYITYKWVTVKKI